MTPEQMRKIDALIEVYLFNGKPWICNFSEETEDWNIYRGSSKKEFSTEKEAREFCEANPRKKSQPSWYRPSFHLSPLIKNYSTSINHAWLVVDRMQQLGFYFALSGLHGRDGSKCYSMFFNKDEAPSKIISADEDTPMLAIAKAALAAVGYNETKNETI